MLPPEDALHVTADGGLEVENPNEEIHRLRQKLKDAGVDPDA